MCNTWVNAIRGSPLHVFDKQKQKKRRKQLHLWKMELSHTGEQFLLCSAWMEKYEVRVPHNPSSAPRRQHSEIHDIPFDNKIGETPICRSSSRG